MSTPAKSKPSPRAARAPSRKKSRVSVWLKIAMALQLLLLCIPTFSNLIGPENWWFGSLNLYLPQWMWAFPLLILLPWYVARAPRWVWVPLLALLWIFGPLMGMRWRWTNPALGEVHGTRLRVMTYNVKWGRRNAGVIVDEIERYKPDVVLMQDAGESALYGPLRALQTGWNVRTNDQYIILSHFPLSDVDVRWISYPDHYHRVIRCTLEAHGRKITLYDAHLMTPRWGLGAIRHPRSMGGVGGLEANVDIRMEQATLLADHIRGESGPLLLTGDLNAPVQSLVCRKLFNIGLRDAFDAAGRGYGYSYGQSTKIRWPYVRIDHIMTSPEWKVVDCWVGASNGSDHSPVIADLFLPDA